MYLQMRTSFHQHIFCNRQGKCFLIFNSVIFDSYKERALKLFYYHCILCILTRSSDLIMRVSSLLNSVPMSETRKELEYFGDQHR